MEPIEVYICTICRKSVPVQHYIKDKLICQCCDEISKGGTRTCILCNAVKTISLFERPWFNKCKKWAAKITKERYFKGSKIMITCECGSVIKNNYNRFHIKTKKHLDFITKQTT